MKRIVLLLITALLSGALQAQTSRQIDFGALQKRLDKSNADIEHPKKSLNFNTWITRAQLMMEINDAMLLNATTGISTNEFRIIVGTPRNASEEEVDGRSITKYEMGKVDFYFVDDMLEYWVVIEPMVNQPLIEALASLQKSIEVDQKSKGAKKQREVLSRLKYAFISDGSNCYSQKNYVCSFNQFAKAVEIGEMPLVNHVDTAVIYYAGLSAQVGGMYEKAIEYYQKSIEYNFTSEGNIYYNIYEAFVSMERSEEGLKFLEDGFLKFPNNQTILYGLINYYISKGDDPNTVLEYIGKAKERDPNESSLYFAEGTLHDKLNNFEGAEKAYKAAIEIKPDFFDALFNLGALYFNNGVKYLEEANKVPAREFDKYDALIAKSNDEFRKSIPYMERAYKVDSNNLPVIESLRNLYFRFRNDGAEIMQKYEEINEKWNQIK
jgi:tetratricopeptide (TPR) repeat protein